MLTRQHIQEDLSKAYIQAVAARAGVNLSLGAQSHDYGVDGTFHQVHVVPLSGGGTRRFASGFSLDFQCKASSEWAEEADHIVYDLEVKTYNDLVYRSSLANAAPMILVLMCLPKDERLWLSLTEDELLLRRCCYWHRLSGIESGNASTKRIRVPRPQRLDPAAVTELLAKVERGLLR